MTKSSGWLSLPMTLTLARFGAAPVLIVLCRLESAGAGVAALAVLALAMLTDLLDGHLARKYDCVTDVGRLLDPLADAFIYISLFLCFFLADWMPLWMFVAILYREILMHGLLRRLLLLKGIVLAASRWGKLKTLLQTISGLFVLASIAALRTLPEQLDSLEPALRTAAFWALLAATVASVASFGAYAVQAARQLRAA